MSDEKTQDADISMHLLDEDEENVPIKKKSIYFLILDIEDRILTINERNKCPSNRITTSKYKKLFLFIRYNVVTFLPISLYEQFRKLANLYFLLICVLMVYGSYVPKSFYKSPLSPISTLGPLAIVVGITMVKEALEDIKRHKSDNEVNHRKVQKLKNGEIESINWEDVRVGDTLKLFENDEIPADIVLLSSTDKNKCYIETSNVDGETNLKLREGVRITKEEIKEAENGYLTGIIKCEPPNSNLYSFTGVYTSSQKEYPLFNKNLLIRGCYIRRTESVVGTVVYTGKDTKVMSKITSAKLKVSSVDRKINIYLLIIIFVQMILCVCTSLYKGVWEDNNIDKVTYLMLSNDDLLGKTKRFFGDFIVTFILLSNFVPISLYVTIEMIHYILSKYIENDLDMSDEINKHPPAIARTSNLHEELGQVEYIFSDKTGTLTENNMIFRVASINNQIYTMDRQTILSNSKNINDAKRDNSQSNSINDYFRCITLCHTGVIENSHGKLLFQSQSPDEVALLNGADKNNYKFEGDEDEFRSVNIDGLKEKYEVLAVNDFNSYRKRMSVIVKSQAGKYILYCKGADTTIFPLSIKSSIPSNLENHLYNFATEGYRTLIVAKRELTEEEYRDWMVKYNKAVTSLRNRASYLNQVAEEIETNLEVLGITGIEDKLQDGVPEALETLKEAGIKLWILTGDKMETAINIGYSCGLLYNEGRTIQINSCIENEVHKQISNLFDKLSTEHKNVKKNTIFYTGVPKVSRREINKNIENPQDYYIVISGNSLLFVLNSKEYIKKFLFISQFCSAVIACRVSPGQKAELVEIVNSYIKPSPVTLAIGDGANDVNMIKAAKIGIGICGKEGTQAVNSSDYAISQFRYLVKLLLIHGQWNYNRVSTVILYSFYKNITLAIILCMFNWSAGFSGTSLFESLVYAGYNFFLGVTVVGIGIFDRYVDNEVLLDYPQFYVSGRSNVFFNYLKVVSYLVRSFLHAIIIYIVVRYSLQTTTPYDEGSLGYYGTVVYTNLILIMNWEVSYLTKTWTIINVLLLVLSVGAYFLFIYCYSLIIADTDFFSEIGKLLFIANGHGWFEILFCGIVVIICDYLLIYIKDNYYPLPVDILNKYNELVKSIGTMNYTQTDTVGTKLSWDFIITAPMAVGKTVAHGITRLIPNKHDKNEENSENEEEEPNTARLIKGLSGYAFSYPDDLDYDEKDSLSEEEF